MSDIRVYERFWDIAYKNLDKIAMVLIYSWNAYGEQSVIEPALDGPMGTGGMDGLGLLQKTRDGFNRLLGQ